MADSRILEIGDAIVTQVAALSNAETEVVRTFWKRYDAETTTGRKAYVVCESDEPTDPSQGGDRGHDPFLYRYRLAFAERIPKTVRSYEDKDATVDSFVDWVTVVRDWFDESRDFSLVEGVPLVPVETGVRTTVDLGILNELGVCYSEFTTAIREG